VMAQCRAAYKGTDDSHAIAPRKLWLLDSFEGLPSVTAPADTESPHVQSGCWAWKVAPGEGPTPEDMKRLCRQFLADDNIEVIKGWYKDTLDLIPKDTSFALVHIDCDLYESTYDVLQYLFHNMMFSDGCMLFFDDWYCNRANPNFGEQAAWRVIRSKYNAYDVTDLGPYAMLGHRFILHSPPR
jgi:O-methyltransferase